MQVIFKKTQILKRHGTVVEHATSVPTYRVQA